MVDRRTPLTRRAWSWMVALVLVRALALVASVSDHRPLTGDEPIYDGVARSLLAGTGFTHHGAPWVMKPPGWVIVLAGIRAVAGDHVRAGVLVQGLFDAGTILLGALLARRLFRSSRAGWIAFALMAVWPPFLRESRFLQTEPMFTLAVMLLATAFVGFVESPTMRRAALTGAAAGLAALVRPNGILTLVGLVGSAYLIDRRARAPILRYVVMALCCALVLSPWTIRNARVFHAFIPVSIGTGEFFYMGSTPETEGRWDHVKWEGLRGRVIEAETRRLGRTPNVLEQDHALLVAGMAAWQTDPATQFRIWMLRVFRLVAVPVGPERFALRVGFLIAILLLDALALWGAFGAFGDTEGNGRMAAVFLLAVVFNALALSVFLTASRYIEPFRALMIVVAAGGATRLPSLAQRKSPIVLGGT